MISRTHNNSAPPQRGGRRTTGGAGRGGVGGIIGSGDKSPTYTRTPPNDKSRTTNEHRQSGQYRRSRRARRPPPPVLLRCGLFDGCLVTCRGVFYSVPWLGVYGGARAALRRTIKRAKRVVWETDKAPTTKRRPKAARSTGATAQGRAAPYTR